MTALEEVKEIFRKYRETNDFESFRESLYRVDFDSEKDKTACNYVIENISFDEARMIFLGYFQGGE